MEIILDLHTKLEVTKGAKQHHVGDYLQLVLELDEAEYQDILLMVMEIRNAYAVLYDIILKNFEKLKKPRGETRGMIY
uniref:Proteasome activator PA28 C-terminal domain-containing protein n=1 Tax=Cricetulus griseus TaxID=10029 RepID=A0A8C2LA13_CRIGR